MKNLSLLIKPASGSCNMRCKYCFYADIGDIREEKNRGMMRLDTLEMIVKKALSEATASCVFGFQGGEPTLAGLDFFHALVAFVRRYNANNIQVAYTLQTNGLLIDESWASFLAENRFLTGISIDAGKKVHDQLRPDFSGKGTHSRSLKAAGLLSKHRAEFNILSVVTKHLAAHPDRVYNFYKQSGFRYIQFIPCLDALEHPRKAVDYLPDAKIYGKFLCRVFDLWYSDYLKGEYVSIRAFDNYINMLAGHPPENCAMSGVCSAYALIEADGSVYPCDFYALDAFLLGTVGTHSFEELLRGEAAEKFIAPSRQIHPECANCKYLFICRGGCRRDREPMANGSLALNKYCEAYKMFFEHALPHMTRIASLCVSVK